MATNTPAEIGGNDPSILRQIERQNTVAQTGAGLLTPPTVSTNGNATSAGTTSSGISLAPIVTNTDTLYPQSTAGTTSNAVTITSSYNNQTGDVTTVYSSATRIVVNPINQTINQYTSTDSGVSQILAGTGVTITSTGASGTGVVTINSDGGGANYTLPTASAGTLGGVKVGSGLSIDGAGVLSTTVGNIATTNYDGNAANVLHGDGTWSADVTDYGNSNVANYLPTYTGNMSGDYLTLTHDANANVVYANYLYGDGSNITNLPAVTGSSIANGSSNITIPVANGNITVNAGAGQWVFDTTGRINLPGGDAQIEALANYFGIWANGSANTNGIEFHANGSGFLSTDGSFQIDTNLANGIYSFAFRDDGSLIFPNNSNIYPAGNNFNVFTPPAGSVQFYSDNGNYSWSLDGFGVMNLPLDASASNTASMYAAGNIRFNAAANSFVFTDTGAFVFPTLTVDLHNGGNQTAQTLQFGDDTQQAIITGPTPAANVNAQRLIIQGQRGNGTGEGGDVYFWAGDADTNGGDIKIYAGDADSGTGYGGYINIDAGNGPDGGGQLSLSGGYSANGQGGTVNIGAGQGGTDGGAVNINGGGAGANQGGNIALTGGYGGNNGGEVRLTGGSAGTGIPGYGNVVLVSGASTWTFDNGGLLSLPGGNTKIGLQYGTEAILASNTSFGVATQGANVTTFINWSDDVSNTSQLSAIYVNAPNANPGDIHFRTGNVGSPNFWQFNVDGNLVLPNGNSVIYSIANSSLDPLNPNVSTMTLTPDANYNSQVLVLDPTAPGHIHLRAYAFSNIDEPAANIFLGGEDTAFEITSGANNEARIHSNNYTWTYGNDGSLSFPRDAVGNTDPYLVITGGPAPAISSVDVSLAGPANLQLVSDYLNLSGYTGAKVVVRADDGEIMADANMVLTTNAANVGNEFSWTFATDGSLTLAGNLISSGASPAPSISGFSSISTLVSLNTPVAYSSLTAIAGLRAFINDANLVAAGNFGQQVSGGGANSTPVWSDGTNWYIG